jgi:hypothetical protein
MNYQMNPIEEFIVERDIELIYEVATDFGQDIAQSYVRLAEKTGHSGEKRDCYGLVLKTGKGMEYRGAFTQLCSNEGLEKQIPVFTIPSGKYYSILIENWNQKLLEIGPTFDQILQSGKVDTMSPCIEYYRTESELICMVKASA